METKTETSVIPPEVLAELQEAADNAAQGIREPEAARQALERLTRRREEIRQKHGLLDIAVPSIRELRDEE
jgi:rRNA-processing protein FCF1